MPRCGAVWTALAVLFAGACDAERRPDDTGGSVPPLGRAHPTDRSEPVATMFRNVRLHVDDSLMLEISTLQGALISTEPGKPPVFDDQRSFTLRIDTAEIAMSAPSVAHLMNRYVFAYKGSPLSGVEITFENGQIKQHAKLHKGVKVPFTILADVSVTDDGRMRLHPTSVKVLGVSAGGLLNMLGLELDDVVSMRKVTGVHVEKDDILLAFNNLMPAPQIDGQLKSVRIEGDRIVQFFGGRSASDQARPKRAVRTSCPTGVARCASEN